MHDPSRTNQELIEENSVLKQKAKELGQSEAARKQTEEALRKSEQRFRAIFNSTFQFTGLMTPDGMLIEANQTALDFAGIKLEDIINQPFWETRWWQGNETRVSHLKEAISRAAKGEFVRFEVELQGADDTAAMIDFSLKPVLARMERLNYSFQRGATSQTASGRRKRCGRPSSARSLNPPAMAFLR